MEKALIKAANQDNFQDEIKEIEKSCFKDDIKLECTTVKTYCHNCTQATSLVFNYTNYVCNC